LHAPLNDLPRLAADLIERLRARAPRVHCITNGAAQAFTANVLLAAGATPSLTIAPEEIAAFTASADALLVNLGTFDAERREAAEMAVAAATEQGRPWVLDPVFIDRSPKRAEFAKVLAVCRPAALRLNRAEFTVLAAAGPDEENVRRYALDNQTVVGLTGTADLITDGARLIRIGNGHPLMGRVTAMGCAASALAAGFLAVERDALVATASALLCLGVAGEIAAGQAAGPGSFAVAILDSIHNLDRGALVERARVS
jgi:hydroxyethylthiazole kinase